MKKPNLYKVVLVSDQEDMRRMHIDPNRFKDGEIQDGMKAFLHFCWDSNRLVNCTPKGDGYLVGEETYAADYEQYKKEILANYRHFTPQNAKKSNYPSVTRMNKSI